MNPITNINEYADSLRKEKVGIPNGSIVKALMLQCKFTKRGEEQQSIIGGIALKFAFLSYYKGEGNKTELVQLIDYSDINNIRFPADILNSDGTTSRPGIMSMPVYLTENVLKARNFNKVDTEQACIALYAYEFSKRFGIKSQLPFIQFLIGTGLAKTVTHADFNIQTPQIGFPVFTVRRYTDRKYDKKDLNPATKEPYPGAEKRFVEELTVYNKDLKASDLESIDVEYVTAESAIAINSALIKRADEKKAESGTAQGPEATPF